nr:hypothetical protein Iba_chr10aCG13640 [Ipomoea batatas]
MPGKLGLGCHSFRWVLSGAGLKQPDRNLRIANRNLESHSAPDAVTPRPPPAPACSATRLACWSSPVGFFAVRHTADLSLVSSPVGRCPSGRSVSQIREVVAMVDARFSGGGRQRRQSSLSPFASSKSQEATSSFSLSTAPQS